MTFKALLPPCNQPGKLGSNFLMFIFFSGYKTSSFYYSPLSAFFYTMPHKSLQVEVYFCNWGKTLVSQYKCTDIICKQWQAINLNWAQFSINVTFTITQYTITRYIESMLYQGNVNFRR